jgi:predicted nucleic acid-binding protein
VIALFDTSALILAARVPAIGDILAEAVAADELATTEPILLEYLNGARNLAEYERFSTGFGAAQLLPAGAEDWVRALEVHRALAANGAGHQRSVRIQDLVIAAVAERHAVPVLHYDEDFDRIAAITGQPTRWVAPRGSI